MNVKFVFIFFIVLLLQMVQLERDIPNPMQIEVEYENPYEEEMQTLKEEMLDFYPLVQQCVDKYLLDSPLADSKEIGEHCTGTNFSMIKHIFQHKIKKLIDIYEMLLRERFENLGDSFESEINFFIEMVKKFMNKGYYNIYETLQVAKVGAKYHIQPHRFSMLLAMSKDILEMMVEFNKDLRKDKTNIKKYIDEKLEERDRNLEAMMGEEEEEEEGEEEPIEIDKGDDTENKLDQIDESIEEEEEELENEGEPDIPSDEDDLGTDIEDESDFTPVQEEVEAAKEEEGEVKGMDEDNPLGDLLDDEEEEDTPEKLAQLRMFPEHESMEDEDMPVNFNPNDPINNPVEEEEEDGKGTKKTAS